MYCPYIHFDRFVCHEQPLKRAVRENQQCHSVIRVLAVYPMYQEFDFHLQM